MKKFTFDKKYFSAAIILFVVEVLIALYVRDAFIRPYGGDFLVVILLYCALKSFLKIPVKNAIFGVLLFSWLVETLQYFRITRLLRIEENSFISVVLGSHFEWLDIFIYTLAAFALYWVEQIRRNPLRKLN